MLKAAPSAAFEVIQPYLACLQLKDEIPPGMTKRSVMLQGFGAGKFAQVQRARASWQCCSNSSEGRGST